MIQAYYIHNISVPLRDFCINIFLTIDFHISDKYSLNDTSGSYKQGNSYVDSKWLLSVKKLKFSKTESTYIATQQIWRKGRWITKNLII